jgi:hypothetical protein
MVYTRFLCNFSGVNFAFLSISQRKTARIFVLAIQVIITCKYGFFSAFAHTLLLPEHKSYSHTHHQHTLPGGDHSGRLSLATVGFLLIQTA